MGLFHKDIHVRYDPVTGAPISLAQLAAIGTAATVPTNGSVTVNAATTVLLAANAVRTGALIKNTGTQTVFLAFGEAATTAKFPLGVGETLAIENPLAVNGIVAAGTGSVGVLEEARA